MCSRRYTEYINITLQKLCEPYDTIITSDCHSIYINCVCVCVLICPVNTVNFTLEQRQQVRRGSWRESDKHKVGIPIKLNVTINLKYTSWWRRDEEEKQ